MDLGRTDDDTAKPGIRIADTRADVQPEEKYKLLSTFQIDNAHPQLIHIRTEEFSAVCPGTGLPDIGTLDIEYIPQEKCVELKALKYYLFAYRDEGIFQEPVTDLIYGHLLRLLEPRYLRVQMAYNTRGGFDTTVTCEHGSRAALNPTQQNHI